MNRKALYALLIALILPLLGYFIMKALPSVQLPQPVFSDSVITKIKDGKKVEETVWSRVPDFKLVNQLGDTVSWKDMEGKVIVANFFFTHCPTICPPLARNMKRLQETVKKNQRVGDLTADYVQFLSFSVDPIRDSVPQLKKWADRFQVDPVNWWLLTGDSQTIYDLSINHMKLLAQDPQGVDTAFVHTDIFVLIDRDRIIRARWEENQHGDKNPVFYHGLDSTSLKKLVEDIVLLNLEKDRSRKGFLAGKLEVLAVVVLIAMISLGVFLLIFRKKSKA